MEKVLLFLAVLPTIILGSFIYKNDKMGKEPSNLLIKLLSAGFGSAILTLFVSEIMGAIIPFFNTTSESSLGAFDLAIYVFFGIALVEELSKWIFAYLIAWNNKEFNHVYDAIVYCVFVSLGFATFENILYVFANTSVADALVTALVRMILSVPGHAFFGVFMGYYLGLAKLTHFNNKKDKSLKFTFLSIIVPSICHFLFDYLLMINSKYSFLIFIVFVVIMFSIALTKVKRLSTIPTNIFNAPQRMDYIYNNFGNYNNYQNNYQQYQSNMYNNQQYQQPIITKRNCPNCGQLVDSTFCTNCGTKVN